MCVTTEPSSVLLVSSKEPPALLVDLLQQGASVVRAFGHREAREILATDESVRVVVTDEDLTDGDWRAVLADALRANNQMQVVVFTGAWPDVELFREARARRARSLLVEPYDRHQVECLLEGARSVAPTNTRLPAGKSPRASTGAVPRPDDAVLVVSSGRECDGLMRRLQSHGLDVRHASNLLQTRNLIETNRTFTLVITAERLSDGNWRGVVDDVRQACADAQVFVATDSGNGPGLRLETVSKGAILVRLQDRKQVEWVTELAAARHRWRENSAAQGRAA